MHVIYKPYGMKRSVDYTLTFLCYFEKEQNGEIIAPITATSGKSVEDSEFYVGKKALIATCGKSVEHSENTMA